MDQEICSLISAKLLLVFSTQKGIRMWLSAFPLMYHAFSHQCPKYCGINICRQQNANLCLYGVLLRKLSAKPSAPLCSGAFVHHSRNKEWKRVCQCESFIKLACERMPTLCGLAVVFLLCFELSQPRGIKSVPTWFWSVDVFITPRDLPNNSFGTHDF